MEDIQKIYTELDELVTVTEDEGLKKCYQSPQHHLVALLAPEYKTPLLYRELKTLWYNYTKLGQIFVLPIMKSLAKNCAEYIEGDLQEAQDCKNEFKYNYVKSIEEIIYNVSII